MFKKEAIWLLLTVGVWLCWAFWLVLSAQTLPPGHDELITMLQMRGHANPSFLPLASIVEQQQIFSGPLADFSDVSPMLLETDVHPPLYYHLALFVSKIGFESLPELRLLSLSMVSLGGAALLYLSWRMSEKRFWAVFLSAVFLMSSGPVIYAAINVRNYGLLFLLFSLMSLGLFYVNKHKGWRHVGVCSALAVLSVLALWTHYFAALGVAALFFGWFVFSVRTKFQALSWGLSSVFVALCAWPLKDWLDVHLHARDNQYEGFRGGLEFLSMLRIFSEQGAFGGNPESPWNMILILGVGFGVLGVVLLALMQKTSFFSRQYGTVFVMGSALLLGLFWYTDKTLVTLDSSRYALFLIVFFVPLLGWSATKIQILLPAIVTIGATSWVMSDIQFDPWGWENAFPESVEYLQDETHLAVFGGSRRGIEGAILYRAQTGFAAMPNGHKDFSRFVENHDVSEVRFFEYLKAMPAGKKESWKKVLRESGFEEGENSSWTLTP